MKRDCVKPSNCWLTGNLGTIACRTTGFRRSSRTIGCWDLVRAGRQAWQCWRALLGRAREEHAPMSLLSTLGPLQGKNCREEEPRSTQIGADLFNLLSKLQSAALPRSDRPGVVLLGVDVFWPRRGHPLLRPLSLPA
jgi:hypothetical protein